MSEELLLQPVGSPIPPLGCFAPPAADATNRAILEELQQIRVLLNTMQVMMARRWRDE